MVKEREQRRVKEFNSSDPGAIDKIAWKLYGMVGTEVKTFKDLDPEKVMTPSDGINALSLE